MLHAYVNGDDQNASELLHDYIVQKSRATSGLHFDEAIRVMYRHPTKDIEPHSAADRKELAAFTRANRKENARTAKIIEPYSKYIQVKRLDGETDEELEARKKKLAWQVSHGAKSGNGQLSVVRHR